MTALARAHLALTLADQAAQVAAAMQAIGKLDAAVPEVHPVAAPAS